LFALNGMPTDRLPKVKVGEITHVDLGVLGDFISKMASAGAMQPDAELDNFLRDLANLPPRSEEEAGMMPQGVGMPPEAQMPQAQGQVPPPVDGAPQGTTDLFSQLESAVSPEPKK
jgi:hypothetical protein